MKYFYKNIILIFILLLGLSDCRKNLSPEEKEYIERIEKYRVDKDIEMKTAAYSPFVRDSNAHYDKLKYFDVSFDFVFKSKLHVYDQLDSVEVYGTKGELRKYLKYGFVEFSYRDKRNKMNVYKGKSKSGQEFYMLQFTDRTTNNETYGVGRYLDFELNDNKDFLYTIDFNLAYNPYCAYSSMFSCSIPRKEDYLDMAINAGEKKFHK